eukprot:gene38570-52108_t
MENNRFETPVTVKSVTAGSTQLLRTAREASDYLLNSWPGKRSPKHRAALQACHDALAGDKPAMNARRAFIAAAREIEARPACAGLLPSFRSLVFDLALGGGLRTLSCGNLGRQLFGLLRRFLPVAFLAFLIVVRGSRHVGSFSSPCGSDPA